MDLRRCQRREDAPSIGLAHNRMEPTLVVSCHSVAGARGSFASLSGIEAEDNERQNHASDRSSRGQAEAGRGEPQGSCSDPPAGSGTPRLRRVR